MTSYVIGFAGLMNSLNTLNTALNGDKSQYVIGGSLDSP